MNVSCTCRSTVEDLYPDTHWARRGDAPGFDTPDEDVYLVGRNIVLLSKAAIYCSQHDIGRIALGPLAGNPFPDATPQFFSTMGKALSIGLGHTIAIDTPFARMSKSEVITLGSNLNVPFALTLSCMSPQQGLHCGRCSKCRERRDAFAEAGVVDPARYATNPVTVMCESATGVRWCELTIAPSHHRTVAPSLE